METLAVSRRDLPSVDRLLQSPPATLMVQDFGRDLTTQALRAVLAEARAQAVQDSSVPDPDQLLVNTRRRLEDWLAPSLRPVINASGVIVHTNLGRAPLSQAALEAIQAIARSYNTPSKPAICAAFAAWAKSATVSLMSSMLRRRGLDVSSNPLCVKV